MEAKIVVENTREGLTHFDARTEKREDGFCCKLTAKKVRQIRSLKGHPLFTAEDLAALYGVNKSTISDVWYRITWKRLDPPHEYDI